MNEQNARRARAIEFGVLQRVAGDGLRLQFRPWWIREQLFHLASGIRRTEAGTEQRQARRQRDRERSRATSACSARVQLCDHQAVLRAIAALQCSHAPAYETAGYILRVPTCGLIDARRWATGSSELCYGYVARSEERRGGKECVSRCRSRWWAYH